jgi:hypothetical protein
MTLCFVSTFRSCPYRNCLFFLSLVLNHELMVSWPCFASEQYTCNRYITACAVSTYAHSWHYLLEMDNLFLSWIFAQEILVNRSRSKNCWSLALAMNSLKPVLRYAKRPTDISTKMHKKQLNGILHTVQISCSCSLIGS